MTAAAAAAMNNNSNLINIGTTLIQLNFWAARHESLQRHTQPLSIWLLSSGYPVGRSFIPQCCLHNLIKKTFLHWHKIIIILFCFSYANTLWYFFSYYYCFETKFIAMKHYFYCFGFCASGKWAALSCVRNIESILHAAIQI